jgi:hypothetical protein
MNEALSFKDALKPVVTEDLPGIDDKSRRELINYEGADLTERSYEWAFNNCIRMYRPKELPNIPLAIGKFSKIKEEFNAEYLTKSAKDLEMDWIDKCLATINYNKSNYLFLKDIREHFKKKGEEPKVKTVEEELKRYEARHFRRRSTKEFKKGSGLDSQRGQDYPRTSGEECSL